MDFILAQSFASFLKVMNCWAPLFMKMEDKYVLMVGRKIV